MRTEGVLLADGFEDAYLGLARQFTTWVAVYDYDLCLDVLMSRDGMSRDEASDFFEFNVVGGWVGKQTPVFLEREELAQI
tara:strand:- start:570 stop:809 length:240 start_codon:yes stop_codon:yes gene_type:complete